MSQDDQVPLITQFVSKVTNKKDDSVLKVVDQSLKKQPSTFATFASLIISVPSLIGA